MYGKQLAATPSTDPRDDHPTFAAPLDIALRSGFDQLRVLLYASKLQMQATCVWIQVGSEKEWTDVGVGSKL